MTDEFDFSAQKVQFALENKFPSPISRAFYQLRAIEGWLAQVPQLANVLGITLEHLSILALSEYLSGSDRSPSLNSRLKDLFKKPVSHGLWASILRDVLTFFESQSKSLFVSQLMTQYFPHNQEHRENALSNRIDRLVELRNKLLKQIQIHYHSLPIIRTLKKNY